MAESMPAAFGPRDDARKFAADLTATALKKKKRVSHVLVLFSAEAEPKSRRAEDSLASFRKTLSCKVPSPCLQRPGDETTERWSIFQYDM